VWDYFSSFDVLLKAGSWNSIQFSLNNPVVGFSGIDGLELAISYELVNKAF